jgi:hypothetical protein
MAQQSARRGWKNQANSERFERAYVIWIRSANSHTGQQPKLRKQAGQMAASDHAHVVKMTLAFRQGVQPPYPDEVQSLLEQPFYSPMAGGRDIGASHLGSSIR